MGTLTIAKDKLIKKALIKQVRFWSIMEEQNLLIAGIKGGEDFHAKGIENIFFLFF